MRPSDASLSSVSIFLACAVDQYDNGRRHTSIEFHGILSDVIDESADVVSAHQSA